MSQFIDGIIARDDHSIYFSISTGCGCLTLNVPGTSWIIHWIAPEGRDCPFLFGKYGPVSISDKTSHCKISWSLEIVRFVFRFVWSLLNWWQAHRQHCCRRANQISKQCNDLNYQSGGFDTGHSTYTEWHRVVALKFTSTVVCLWPGLIYLTGTAPTVHCPQPRH